MTDYVTVCCKTPHGFWLELDELHHDIPGLGGTVADVYRPSGKRFQICGSLADHAKSNNHGRVVAGYGLTEVPADFWEAWVKQHKGFPPLTNGTLFAQPNPDRAGRQAKEQTTIKTGMEPMDPNKPAKGITPEDFRPS